MTGLKLFIEGREITLNDDVRVSITKQFEDVSNPTVVINDWTKTINIPFCDNNNEIFGHIYSPERVIIQPNSDSLTGVYFDPTKKLDFRLEYGSDVIMSGYAKMNSITKTDGFGTYNITLNGELGRVFQELQKITFNVNSEDKDYIINGTDYLGELTINSNLVENSWTSPGQTHESISHPSITATDIIGFAPNNSYNDGFDYKTFQLTSTESKTFTDVLKEKWDDGNGGYVTGIDPDTAIPNGLLPRDIGEFRSYYQTPFIYWNKLWQIFQKKAESVTNYTFDLDSDWFKTNNPYWYKLVYMLKNFNVEEGNTNTNFYPTIRPNSFGLWTAGNSTPPPYTTPITQPLMIPKGASYVSEIVESDPLLVTYTDQSLAAVYPHVPTSIATFKVPDSYSSMIFKFAIQNLWIEQGNIISTDNHIKDGCGLLISVRMYGSDITDAELRTNPTFSQLQSGSWLVQENNYVVVHQGSGTTYQDYNVIETGDVEYTSSQQSLGIPVSFNSSFYANASNCGARVYFTITTRWMNDTPPLVYGNPPYYVSFRTTNPSRYTDHQSSISLDVNMSTGVIRSGNTFTLNDLWNSDVNLFEQILNYCKMYRILVFADYYNKKLKFIPAYKYFHDYTIENWSDKLDMSKDYVITPLTFDHKYVLFNYTDNSSRLGERYRTNWGIDYGEMKLITNYNFNNESSDLFNNITSSMTNTDNSLSWNNLYGRNSIAYFLPAEILPYSKDDSDAYINSFGSFFFHNGLRYFDDEDGQDGNPIMRAVSISDDTILQQSTNTFFYSQTQSENSVTTYPNLDIVSSDGKKLCLFNTPTENYTYNKNYSGTSGIYEQFWKVYLDERYNLQNKLITCYLNIKPEDFKNFEFKKFIYIDGYLYMINKIYDYDILNSGSTKVDLISIQNPGAYYTTYFNDYLNLSTTSMTLDTVSSSSSVTIDSYSPWKYELLDADGNIVNVPYYLDFTWNGNTLTVTKTNDNSVNLVLKITNLTETKNVIIKGSRTPYRYGWVNGNDSITITYDPQSTNIHEFVLHLETNMNFDMGGWGSATAGGSIQVQSPDTGNWNNTYQYRRADGSDLVFDIPIKTTGLVRDGASIIVYTEGQGLLDPYLVQIPIYISSPHQLSINPSTADINMNGETLAFTGYSSSSWEATLPEGVQSYGPITGDPGEFNMTLSFPAGEQGTTVTVPITNSEGDSVNIVVTRVYVSPHWITVSSPGWALINIHGGTVTMSVESSSAWNLTIPEESNIVANRTTGPSGTTTVYLTCYNHAPGREDLWFYNVEGDRAVFTIYYDDDV